MREPTRRRRQLVLAICCASMVVSVMDVSINNVALPTIRHDLRASISSLQPVQDAQGGQAGQTGQDGAAALHQALGQNGVNVDASAVDDHEAVHRVVYQLHQWYSALDQASKAIVDQLCGDGLTHLLADSEVGVVQEGHDFLYGLASTGHTLGSALDASGAALQQAHGNQS